MQKQTDTMMEPESLSGFYTFVLSLRNEKRGMVFDDKGRALPDPEYPPFRNLLLTSSIIWPWDKDKNGKLVAKDDPFTPGKKRPGGRYRIRYYDGCSTLFVDDQPRDKETIDQLTSSTQLRHFVNGYLRVNAYDTMLLKYVTWASWNEESPYKVPNVGGVYKLLNQDKERKATGKRVDRIEEALKLASEADVKHMLTHCRFLNVETVDSRTMQDLNEESIRIEYRKAALDNPEKFISTFNDKTLLVKVWIEQAIASGVINTSLIPNKVTLGDSGMIVCDISGINSYEGILNKLIEHSQLPEGEEFLIQLKGLYS